MLDKKQASPKEEILLGIDYGGKNTGLAFGRSGVAMPLKVITSSDENVVVSEIARVALENRVTKLVMGLPLTLEGKETEQSLIIRRFSKVLKIRLKKPLVFVDESDSSSEAIEYAIKSGSPVKNKSRNDHISAALILKRYYSEISNK